MKIKLIKRASHKNKIKWKIILNKILYLLSTRMATCVSSKREIDMTINISRFPFSNIELRNTWNKSNETSISLTHGRIGMDVYLQ